MMATDAEESRIKNIDISECLELLNKNYIGRLAYILGLTSFINPTAYFHDAEERCILSYTAPGFKIESKGIHGSVAL